MKKIIYLALATVLLAACTTSPETDMDLVNDQQNNLNITNQEEAIAEPQTIVEIAQANPQFSTLVDAIVKADLVETLSTNGPFTVFAPTNDAFAKVDPDTLQALLDDSDALANVLTYHVVSGQVMSTDVVTLTSATTVQGSDVEVSVEDDIIMINDANVIGADIQASNGVIHVIDTVLIPTE